MAPSHRRLEPMLQVVPSPPPVELLGVDELFAPQPAAHLLVPHLGISPGPPTGLFGQGFVGKTIMAMSIGFAVASGRELWGCYSVRAGRWLHLDYEQGLRVTAQRFQRMARAHGLGPEDLRDRVHFAIHPALRLTSKDAEDEYARLFEGRALVTLDALRGLTPGVDENSSEIRDYLGILSRAAERTGAVPLFIHHAGKSPPKGDSARPRKEMGRGSSGIFDECQSVFVLSAGKGEPARVSHEKDRESGRTVDDFHLRIEDVEIDGDPKGGLRVVHLSAEQMQPRDDSRAKFDTTLRAVRECVRENPGIAGKMAVRELVNLSAPSVRAAVDQLLAEGEIVERKARRNGVRLYLKHAAPPEEGR